MTKGRSFSPAFLEDHVSQISALQLLQNLGYIYLRREEAYLERHGNRSNVLLEGVLEKQLRRLNRIHFKGAEHEFSDANIQAAIQALKDVILSNGLIRANERIYDMLSLGKSFEQTIDGDTKSFTLNYVDWERPENNVFQVVDKFEVANLRRTCCADIVLFVNGIPFAVIECHQPDEPDEIDAIRNTIEKHLRNQQSEYIPQLFVYSQILMAISLDEAKYATTGTPYQFWARWRERENINEEVSRLVNKPLTKEQKDKLFAGPFAYARRYFDEVEIEGREVTEQDRAIYCLLRPERLIELARQFIIFDAGRKKIARYQQYFAVKKTLDRIKLTGDDGRRVGGLIWHTQGSGKSLTMVMMAKAIALEESITDPRIVLVTDRIDLDDQIWATFHSCGKEPVKATTGRHLLELLSQRKVAVITTVIDKFETAVKMSDYQNDSNNIFALIDESHRGQYGETNARMQKVLPAACYIGFTGTPIKKKDKNTAAKFGGVIDAYTIDEAVRDKAVAPLLYEGRRVPKETAQRILMIARDLSEHFSRSVPKPFKAQLATESRIAAIKYKQYMDAIGLVSSEVLISSPDTREGDEMFESAADNEVRTFWRQMMERYGSEKEYNRALIEAFNKSDKPEIIIVVDKLLTGFDSPRNAVLYLDKNLKEHSLLQAVARVNRLSEGKEFGFVIDYFGVLNELDKALDLYSSLDAFDLEDVAMALTDISEETAKLPQRHYELWELFEGLDECKDEAFERKLADIKARERFYERFSAFNRTMSVAFSSSKFISGAPGDRIFQYKKDLVFFQKLRMRLKQRYAEELDFREHEARVQKLIDSHTDSRGELRIPPIAPIFDTETFHAQVSLLESTASKAESIANRTRKAIAEKMEEDPPFYHASLKNLDTVMAAWREGRIADVECLERVTDVMTMVRDRPGDDLPLELRNHDAAGAFYRAVNDVFGKLKSPPQDLREIATETAIKINRIIQEVRIVDWTSNPDVKNEMRNQIEDCLYELKKHRGIDLGPEEMDSILEGSIRIAISKYA